MTWLAKYHLMPFYWRHFYSCYLTPRQPRWINGTTGQRKNMGWTVPLKKKHVVLCSFRSQEEKKREEKRTELSTPRKGTTHGCFTHGGNRNVLPLVCNCCGAVHDQLLWDHLSSAWHCIIQGKPFKGKPQQHHRDISQNKGWIFFFFAYSLYLM